MLFKNPIGLYALLALVPFIIIYLRRPKPKERTIPSLMFFMKEKGISRFSNLFKQILSNLLFIIQFLIIISAAFAVAMPFLSSSRPASAEQTIIVIDGSASMGASSGIGTRFEKAVSEAGSRIEGRVGIVFAENIPVVVLDSGSAAQAEKILATLKPKATETSVGDSMLAAGELVHDGKNSKIVVLSDFQYNKGTDVLIAKRSLAARGMRVELVNLAGEPKKLQNVGFVDIDVNKFSTTALVKNYDDVSRTVDITVKNNGNEIQKKQLAIGPRSMEGLSFETMHGNTELKILQDDNLLVDNSAFVCSPSKKIKVLLITNSDSSYIMSALKASPNVELSVSFPPVIKSFGYDVIILENASSQFMLPSFYKEINKVVSNGTGLVIAAQDGLPVYTKQFSMPIELGAVSNASKATVKVENYLTKGIDFGVVSKYWSSRPKNGLTSLVAADDDSVIVGTYTFGGGIVLYYGILDEYSTFKSAYSYPIFWDNLMSFITNSQDIASYNLKTGQVQAIHKEDVQTPSGEIATKRLFIDESGFYTFDGRTVAANLASQEESDVKSVEFVETTTADKQLSVSEIVSKAEILLEDKLIFLALALLLIELLMIKTRGDL
jgi:hypothetical protein